MKFGFPWVLTALAVIPLIWAWVTLRRRRPTLQHARAGFWRQALQQRRLGWRARLMPVVTVLRVVALTALVVALARPYQPPGEDSEDVESIDIVVALDMSGSMAAMDYPVEELERYTAAGKIPPNRFEIARQVLKEVVLARRHDQLGLVVFGAAPFTQFPLTFDKTTIINQLDEMQLEDIDGGGTAMGDALGVAWNRLKESDACSRIVILITDGKEQMSRTAAKEQAQQMAKALPKNTAGCASEGTQGIKIFPILVGSQTNSVRLQGKDAFNRPVFAPYPSETDPELLKDIAEVTHATFTRAADKLSLEKTMRQTLESLEKTRRQNLNAGRNIEMFRAFLWIALAALLAEVVAQRLWLRTFP